jgi:hypothetical protein
VEPYVKQIRILALAAFLSACGGQPQTETSPAPRTSPTVSSSEQGGATPAEALQRFLESIQRQDIQATQLVWGTSRGSVLNSDIPRVEQEKRIIIMQCYLAHDSYRVQNDAPGEDGRRVFRVEFTNRNRVRTTSLTLVRGPRDRWYVESAALEPVQDFCRNPPSE